MFWIAKLGICLIATAFAIYMYIDARNQLIEMQLTIPPIQKKIRDLTAENGRLQFEIDRFESPQHLLQLSAKPEYSHLKTVHHTDILIVTKEFDEKIQ